MTGEKITYWIRWLDIYKHIVQNTFVPQFQAHQWYLMSQMHNTLLKQATRVVKPVFSQNCTFVAPGKWW